MQRLITLLVSSLACAAAPAQERAAHELTLEDVEVALEDGGTLTAQRGVLPVPVVRAKEGSSLIQLELHRFPRAGTPPGAQLGEAAADAAEDAPPIFVLNGGPGFRGLGAMLKRKGFYEQRLARLNAVADVVVVGQRGIGSSGPDTVCARPGTLPLDEPVDRAAETRLIREACRACREHWEAQGLELEGLNVIEAAADVVDVADALGYGKITLSGVSFGSHWGMTVMRYHGERVARAVLSGMEGPDHTYDMPEFVLGALKRIAAAAEASPELAEHVPEGGLVAALAATVARAAAEPQLVEVGEARVLFDAHRVREVALGYSGSTSSRQGIRTWPRDVIAMHGGDFAGAARRLVRQHAMRRLPTAAFFMLDCGSGISPARRERLLADPAAEIVGPLGGFYEAACPAWGSDLGEDFRAAFETDIPTVIVHGTWDTSTPFENALELVPCFTAGRLVVVEGGSHGALGEALRESPAFADALLSFVATGETEGLPDVVDLPALEWAVPE